ncbi:MAG: class I adenylate-forming enzyme family protein [Myxococcota bacterium]|nr:acyl--CoA ligase [bacterium]MDP6074969.1 class I adenylate-forming enzyme family protein [Myxococcota bacterium]MDP6243097.1 class I adenylate-forming enzyme family protein [Myxococcota bacterium]MDP7076272.1 class I adenylate-forming enzyme family protein [Myxococcota bacterium]MDP7298081.1 class I adenylate-forming enzyme family protein [Myxococcota bacterium]
MSTFEEIEAQLSGPGAPFETVEEEVLGERMRVFKNRKRSLRELLEESVAHGDATYLVQDERRIGYDEHLKLVASTARALREQYGVGRGDRVAIYAENWLEWVVAYWATVSLGGVLAALNGWWTRDELLYGVELSDPKLLIADRKRLARVEGHDFGIPVLEIESDAAKLLSYAPGAALPDDPIAEDDPAVILFTSGTTGRPKGAVNSHRAICGFVQTAIFGGARGMLSAVSQGVTPEADPPPTVSLQTVPLFHLSGLYAGATMMLVIGATTIWRRGRFDAEGVLRLLEKESVTNWTGLGSMAPRVLNHPDIERYDLSSLRQLGSGGAPTSPSLLERMKQVAPNGARARGLGYGLSESVASISQISGLELEERPTSVGRVLPTVELAISGPDGNTLPDGCEGEVRARSPYLMLEYWRNPEATAKAILPGRWLATGDVGRIEAGYLYINSRARDMILRAAENIYPVEIEQRLEAHPGVVEAAVVGVDHPELGQEVKAIVVREPGASIDVDALSAWCAEKLAGFKVPAHWEIRSEPLPRNATGKVLKNVLVGAERNTFVEE